ncbi:MAG: glycosyltransferase [Planctomycetes bacterium]|nr:glycosyltransferase [Planctomycetota bacterium]
MQQLRRIGQVIALADDGTASTEALASELRACFPELPVAVRRNRASRAMVAAAERARAVETMRDQVVFGYFAGTRTHAGDLATIEAALAGLLATEPRARLLLAGEVDVPSGLRRFGDRIERCAPVPWTELPALQRRADVHLVPLAPSRFATCKSELKWLEAALVGRPVIATALGPYRACVRDGETGLLAQDEAAWDDALRRMLDDRLRARLGGAALSAAMQAWTTDAP